MGNNIEHRSKTRHFRSRGDHRRNRVSRNSSTSVADDPVSILSLTTPSTVISSSPSFGSSSFFSPTLVTSASENPSSEVFRFGAPCQLFSSSPQIGSFSSSPVSFLSRDSTIPAATTTTMGNPASPSTFLSISFSKSTAHTSTSSLSQNSPLSFSAPPVSSSPITVTTVPTSAPSDFQPTSMPENAENVVDEGHSPPTEEKQMQKDKEEGKRETEPDPAVPQFGAPNSVETLREEVKEMQKSAAEDSCVSELTEEFNLLNNGSRILRGIPQSPNFSSLQDYSGRARKNLISGWDQTFEETYDQIQSLKAIDLWISKDELGLTLDELESMGYDVGQLRKRLDALTNIMEKRESRLFDMWNLRNLMEGHKREKQKLESKIYKLQMQAEKEQAHINGLMDEVARLESSLPAIDSLFASLAAVPL